MPGGPVLRERSASVLDADRRLAGALIAGGASALARTPLLPVLAVQAGDWEPPERAVLGPQTAWLVLLDGWLWHDEAELFGPGDAIEPWSGAGAWRACSHVRLAVMGAALAAALEAAPDVAGVGVTPHARPLRVAGPDGEVPEERLLALLWRLAARWGRVARRGTALPRELDAAALARLLDLSRERTDAALATLLARGALRRGDREGWQLAPQARYADDLRGRRDHLRARLAEQFAIARAVTEDAHALAQDLEAGRSERSGAATRARRRSP